MRATRIRNILMAMVLVALVVSVVAARGNPHKFPDDPVTTPRPIAPIVCDECTIGG